MLAKLGRTSLQGSEKLNAELGARPAEQSDEGACRDPTQVWSEIRSNQVFDPVATAVGSYSTGRGWNRDTHIRIVCISDTHGVDHSNCVHHVPDGDILIHAGDFSNTGEQEQVEDLSKMFGEVGFPHKLVIAGNHDCTFEPAFYERSGKRFHRAGKYDPTTVRAALKNCTYLEDEAVEVQGLNVYGSPWQPEFCDWAFNLPRGKACREKWRLIPTDTDLLVTHGPPLGRGDECNHGNHRAGCEDLLDEVQSRVKPLIHVFGHVHEGYGVSSDGTTLFVNASTCTYNYSPSNPAVVIDVPRRRGAPVGAGGRAAAAPGEAGEAVAAEAAEAAAPAPVVAPVVVQPHLAWGTAEILAWLHAEGLAETFAPCFHQAAGRAIDGQALISMSQQQLKEELQLPLSKERNTFFAAVSKLRSRCYSVL
jgi:Icc-related predicted phosphoesterase